MPRKPKTLTASNAPPKVAFDYIKSQYFRVVRADGAIGAVTPRGLIHFSLFSERPAIPRRTVHALNDDGTLGLQIESETVSRNSVVRELDVDIFLRPDVAKELHTWLGNLIADADAMQKDKKPGRKK
ncbi:MAG TPA: hypothetical protein VJS47_09515 [Rhizomicrobium sp.]|nr:hypothetical protein [Rhizomicrobium sp.]